MTALRSTESAALLVVAGVVTGLLIASRGGPDAPWLAALTLVLAGSLLVQVPVPWGGSAPLGYALTGALPALLAPGHDVLVLVTAVGVAAGAVALRSTVHDALRAGTRLAAGTAGAMAGAAAAAPLVPDEMWVLLTALASVAALLSTDALVTRWLPVDGARLSLLPAVPVYLTLACGAALIAVATEEVGVVMATVAVFPLLITRFSFRRYAGAGETLRQTVQALGLVPELAGLAPLGHSERSSHYARALAGELGLGRAAERIVTASRLHHLGAVPFDAGTVGDDTPPGPGDVAAQGALILREAGFPEDVAELIEAAQSGTLDGPTPSLEAAVVRVAGAFDSVVGDDAMLADRGLALVSATSIDPHSRRAAAALMELVATRPGFVREAIAAGARFRDAASGLDLESLVTSTAGGEILPFARRRR